MFLRECLAYWQPGVKECLVELRFLSCSLHGKKNVIFASDQKLTEVSSKLITITKSDP